MTKKPLENAIQQQVVRVLQSYCRPEVCWFAVPNGEWRFPKTAQRLKLQGVRPGAPDLVFIVGGVFHGVEIKRETGRVSISQDIMGNEIVNAGGHYHVCHGVHEAIKCLTEIGVFTPGVKFTFRDMPPIGEGERKET